MSEWISVKERLPDIEEKVLAYDTQRIYIAYRPSAYNSSGEAEYNEHWSICDDANCSCVGCTGAITHWTYLPRLPGMPAVVTKQFQYRPEMYP